MEKNPIQGGPVVKYDVFEMNDDRCGALIFEYVTSPSQPVDQTDATPFLTLAPAKVRELATRLAECADRLEAAEKERNPKSIH
jgi:hypothetical protein